MEVLTSADFEIKARKPKVLIYDIETAPNLSYIWGKYEQNSLAVEQPWYIMAFCAKWLNGKTISRILPDYDGYKPREGDDKALCEELWNLFNEADITVGHNQNSFDAKKSNARFIVHGLQPPEPYKQIDTKLEARRYFKFDSNKLDDLGSTLGVGRKLKHTGFDLWMDCMNGDEKAWALMRRYNKQDVLLLERVYLKLRPWMTNHPNLAILSEMESGCRNCGSSEMQKRGYIVTATGRRQRYQCQDCGAWMSGKHEARVTIR